MQCRHLVFFSLIVVPLVQYYVNNNISRTHTYVKAYKSDVCSKYCDKLQTHIRTHTDIKSHKCVVCSRGFSQKQDLTRHMKAHEEKPYTFDVLGKWFTRSHHFQIHMRLHTGDSLHKCVACDKSFITKFNMGAHMATHSGDKNRDVKCGK